MNDNQKFNRDYGPWNAKPAEFVTNLEIIALVHKIDNDIIEYEFELDYGNKEDRTFLGRLSFWAMMNNRSVETLNKKEWDKIKI